MSLPEIITLDFPEENIEPLFKEIQQSQAQLHAIEKQLRILQLYHYYQNHHQDAILKIVFGPDQMSANEDMLSIYQYTVLNGLASFIRMEKETKILQDLLALPAFSNMKNPLFGNKELTFTNNRQHRIELFSFFLDDYSHWFCYNQKYEFQKNLTNKLSNLNENRETIDDNISKI
jgi:hypothetical protein